MLASLTQPEVQKAEAAAAAAAAAAAPAVAAPEEDEARASRPPEAPPAMAAEGGPTPAGPALEAAAAAEAQRAKLEAAAQGSPPASASGTHEAWQHKTGPTTVSAAAAAMPTQDFAGIVGESGGQDTRLDQHPLQYGGGQYMPQAGGVPAAGHPMDANGYQQAVQGHNVTVRPAPFNPAAKVAFWGSASGVWTQLVHIHTGFLKCFGRLLSFAVVPGRMHSLVKAVHCFTSSQGVYGVVCSQLRRRWLAEAIKCLV